MSYLYAILLYKFVTNWCKLSKLIIYLSCKFRIREAVIGLPGNYPIFCTLSYHWTLALECYCIASFNWNSNEERESSNFACGFDRSLPREKKKTLGFPAIFSFFGVVPANDTIKQPKKKKFHLRLIFVVLFFFFSFPFFPWEPTFPSPPPTNLQLFRAIPECSLQRCPCMLVMVEEFCFRMVDFFQP